MNRQASKPLVWHISADFPDPIAPNKTPVIRDLLALTDESFEHFVISLNRVSPRPFDAARLAIGSGAGLSIAACTDIPNGIALQYRAPSMGVLHETMLLRLADALIERLSSQPRPALIVGHKLTVEGIVAASLARRLGVPYAITIQGDTDTKILSARRDLAPGFGRIFHCAEVAFPFSPWALSAIESRLGNRQGEVCVLPCPTDLDQAWPPQPHGNGFVTAFHLRNYRRKNLATLVSALKIAQEQGEPATLEVIGGGSEADLAACGKIVARNSGVTMGGALGREALRSRFNQATGFVLPSLRESFGLVFVEALFAGLPIIYPRGQALDGYLDDLPFAMRVDPRSASEVAEAMVHIMANEAMLKSELADWLGSDDAARFQRPAIRDRFAHGLHSAIRSGQAGD